jgi:hypothetical protein
MSMGPNTRSLLTAVAIVLLPACSTGDSDAAQADLPRSVAIAPEAVPITASAAPRDAIVSQFDTLTMVVYKTPTCGCCGAWVDHVKANGFKVEVHDLDGLTEIKRQHSVPDRLSSCHTARIGGYVIEGHVPAEDIQRLLRERPAVHGIAVPGMPMGSPGMEGPRRDSYNVIAFHRDGREEIFARH